MILAQVSQRAAETGIGFGVAIAIVLSWHRNKSILFMIIHGFFSWLYVLYFALTRKKDEIK